MARPDSLEPVRRWSWWKVLLLATLFLPLIYFGGIALLWYFASREVEVSPPATAPAPQAPVALPHTVLSQPKSAEQTAVPTPDNSRPADRTDVGPTNYNPWTDEPPSND